MNKCPKCHKKIDSVLWSEDISCVGQVYKEDKTLMFEETEQNALDGKNYFCPECDEELTEKQMRKILGVLK